MFQSRRLLLGFVILCLESVLLCGCAETRLGRYIPHRSTELPATLQQSTASPSSTPQARIDALRAIAQTAGSMSAEQRNQVSGQLTENLQRERDPLMRRHVVDVLGSLASPAGSQGLRLALQDTDTDVRIAACRAWQHAGGAAATDVLGTVIANDKSVDVRLAAVHALRQFEGPETLRVLAVALDDPDPAMQYRAVEVLRSISATDYGNNLDQWRRLARGETPAKSNSETTSIAGRVQNWFR